MAEVDTLKLAGGNRNFCNISYIDSFLDSHEQWRHLLVKFLQFIYAPFKEVGVYCFAHVGP